MCISVGEKVSIALPPSLAIGRIPDSIVATAADTISAPGDEYFWVVRDKGNGDNGCGGEIFVGTIQDVKPVFDNNGGDPCWEIRSEGTVKMPFVMVRGISLSTFQPAFTWIFLA